MNEQLEKETQPATWLSMNAQLQQKKNRLRKALKEKGVLPKGATNQFDKYKYFSEAQYKELFTDLFSTYGLELKADTLSYEEFGGTDKQPQGRKVTVEFYLMDIETGFYETSRITGEGLDKGDKAGYKAYTGALKYYLASNFAVSTGDDAEKESPELKDRPSDRDLFEFSQLYTEDEQRRIRAKYGVDENKDINGRALRRFIADRKKV